MQYQGYADVVELHSADVVISTCGDALYDEAGLLPLLQIDTDFEEAKVIQASGMRYMADVETIYAYEEKSHLVLKITGESVVDSKPYKWRRLIDYHGTYSVSWIKSKEEMDQIFADRGEA